MVIIFTSHESARERFVFLLAIFRTMLSSLLKTILFKLYLSKGVFT